MPNFEKPQSHERVPKTEVRKPAVEALYDSPENSIWPEHIQSDERFREQVTSRAELITSYEAILSETSSSEMSIAEAIEEGLVSQKQIQEFYNNFSAFLDEDPANKRAILYFPFELLLSESEAEASDLQTDSSAFEEKYMTAWNELLILQDVRANFVDGDVMEIALRDGDLPRVVKAAHLIPKLVEKQFISVDEVISLHERAANDILKNSIGDSIEVLNDFELLTPENIKRIENSADRNTRNLAPLFVTEGASSEETKTSETVITPEQILSRLENDFRETSVEVNEQTTPARAAWLEKIAKEKIVQEISIEIATSILSGNFLLPHLQLVANSGSPEALISGIKGVKLATEQNTNKGSQTYGEFRDFLKLVFLKNHDENVADALTELYAHLSSLGVVHPSELEELHITLPTLGGDFSANLERMKPTLDEVESINQKLETDPFLSETVYPVTLLFGSQLKGYGAQTADVDVAVFIKPETPISQLEEVKKHLHDVYSYEKIGGKALMFWLENTDSGTLKIREISEDPAVGHDKMTHVLFGAAWEGDASVIKELHEKILTPYFEADQTQIEGRSDRDVYLEELERDSLQYRLMHKGFDRYYPPRGRINTPHSGAIDGQSAFWDPSYRRIATQLFMKRSFLPKLD